MFHEGDTSATATGLPMAQLDRRPDNSSSHYVITAVDVRGRLADRSGLQTLAWQPGHPITIQITPAMAIVKGCADGRMPPPVKVTCGCGPRHDMRWASQRVTGCSWSRAPSMICWSSCRSPCSTPCCCSTTAFPAVTEHDRDAFGAQTRRVGHGAGPADTTRHHPRGTTQQTRATRNADIRRVHRPGRGGRNARHPQRVRDVLATHPGSVGKSPARRAQPTGDQNTGRQRPRGQRPPQRVAGRNSADQVVQRRHIRNGRRTTNRIRHDGSLRSQLGCTPHPWTGLATQPRLRGEHAPPTEPPSARYAPAPAT